MKVPGFRFVQAAGNYTDRDGLHFGVAIHATANTASDEAESSYASHREDGTSAHAYVDGDSLTQALDTDRKAGHAGSAYGNENAIAIEFTGLNSWSRDKWLASIAWGEVGRWIAYILKNDPDYRGFQIRRASVAEMKANPLVKAFYGHDDMRRAWGGTDHTDPGPNFPWDRLLGAVNAAVGGAAAGEDDDMTPAQEALLANCERFLTAMGTRLQDDRGPGETEDRKEIVLVKPWTGGPPTLPNPVDWMIDQLEAVKRTAAAGGLDPASVAALVVEQLGPLLPTLADIEAIVDTKVKAALNGTRLTA